MQKVDNVRYQMIGEIAMGLHQHNFKITYDTLKSIMRNNKCNYYSKDRCNRGIAKGVTAAYDAFKAIGADEVSHAIAVVITNQRGLPAYDPEK